MSGSAQRSAPQDIPRELAELCAGLYALSKAEQFGIAEAEFTAILLSIRAKYCPGASSEDVAELLQSLRVEELALARACAAGSERAWEVFLTRFRARLYEAAYAIAHDESRGRELADGLYADLYGTNLRDGKRVSKLESYCGRGSLEGWLRTVLAQQHIDRYRAQARLVSLEEQEEAGTQFAAAQPDASPQTDVRLNRAVDAALGEVESEDRFVLASYFLDQRRLAEIGQVLGIHESSVSRRLEKITAKLRKRILHHLASFGMSRRQAEEALEGDVRDLTVDVRASLQHQREESASGP